MDPFRIIEQLSRWLESSKRHKRESISRYLQIIHATCQAVIDIPPEVTDRSIFLQEKLRALYGDASSVLFPKLKSEEVEVAIRALGSARIFYWIRVLDIDNSFSFGSPEEMWVLIRQRGRLYGRLPASLSLVEGALLAMCREYGNEGDAIKNLRAICLHDIAALDLLHARYVNE